jgi:protein-S-isoprenylcysteine O-methyltransferase Ste14
MAPLLIGVVAYVILTAAASLPFMLKAKAEFEHQGKWSPPTAVMSGVIMHGHFIATLTLSLLDRGSLFAPSPIMVAIGTILFIGGGAVIYLGRYAYGSQQRVYGLLEDELIQHGIYRHTRNPQYVGYAAMFLGAAIVAGSGLALISTLFFIAIIHVFITRVEEPHMRNTFGDAFDQYTRNVRRYM